MGSRFKIRVGEGELKRPPRRKRDPTGCPPGDPPISKQVFEGGTIIRKRRGVTWFDGSQPIGVMGQIVMGHAAPDMMDAVQRFVKQGQRHQPSGPGVGHDAPGGASGGVAVEADVFDVFAPALQIAGKEGGHEVVEEKPGPEWNRITTAKASAQKVSAAASSHLIRRRTFRFEMERDSGKTLARRGRA